MKKVVTDIIRQAAKFSSYYNAEAYRNRSERPGKWAVIMGDYPYFLVVTNREAGILLKSGYELA